MEIFLNSDYKTNGDGVDKIDTDGTMNFLQDLLNINPLHKYENISKNFKFMSCRGLLDTNLDSVTLSKLIIENQDYIEYYLYMINENFPRFDVNDIEDPNIDNLDLIKAFIDCGFKKIKFNGLVFQLDNHYFKKLTKLLSDEDILKYLLDIVGNMDNLNSYKLVDRFNFLNVYTIKFTICTNEIISRKSIKKKYDKHLFHRTLIKYLKICKDNYKKLDNIPHGIQITEVMIDYMC